MDKRKRNEKEWSERQRSTKKKKKIEHGSVGWLG
jgi:hypothetical protein